MQVGNLQIPLISLVVLVLVQIRHKPRNFSEKRGEEVRKLLEQIRNKQKRRRVGSASSEAATSASATLSNGDKSKVFYDDPGSDNVFN
jgi:hypothetical protein